MKIHTVKLQRQKSSENVRVVNQASAPRKNELKLTYTSTSLMSPLDLEEMEITPGGQQASLNLPAAPQHACHESKDLQSTPSSENLENLEIPVDKKSNESVQAYAVPRYSTSSP